MQIFQSMGDVQPHKLKLYKKYYDSYEYHIY